MTWLLERAGWMQNNPIFVLTPAPSTLQDTNHTISLHHPILHPALCPDFISLQSPTKQSCNLLRMAQNERF